MKKITALLTLIGALALATAPLFCSSGCAKLAVGADVFEVRAEQTISAAGDALDLFVNLEDHFRELTKAKAPAVHNFAEKLRAPAVTPAGGPILDARGRPLAFGLSLVNSATNARLAYKHHRSPENRANLSALLALLQAAVRETQTHTDTLNKLLE